MKRCLFFLLLLVAANVEANSVGIGPTLPAACTIGDAFTVTGPPSLAFECLGTDTWRPSGPSRILAIRKGININSANTDFALTMPSVRYVPQSILLTGASVNLSSSTARLGVWTQPSAGGTNIVPASLMQGLTSSTAVANINFSANNTSTLTTIYARCTVAHGSNQTVDLYIIGEILP